MNLPFSTHWPDRMPKHIAGKRTYFPEKIWKSLMHNVGIADTEYYKWHGEESLFNYNMGNNYDDSIFVRPKIHTIRQDSKNRWKTGQMIDFWINYRTKQQFRFAPRIPAKDVPEIEIIYKAGNPIINLEDKPDFQGLQLLTQNDGFNNLEDFFAWFNKDFSGSLINWTDFKY